ncbi:DNA-directed RNA polymerase subunit omega [Oceanirhabdus seepicola]|nr:DNA-directed RNA polymerase subunit omega [Oceanirhabdus seepicola]
MHKSDSMINPSIVDLLQYVDNKYSLVIATSKRARKLIEGESPVIAMDVSKPLTTAIEELNSDNMIVVEDNTIEENTIEESIIEE